MKKLFVILLLLISIDAYCQKEDFHWVAGYDSPSGPPWGGINFSFDFDTMTFNWFSCPINFDNTNASICDKNGNLLFYTNGYAIGNRNLDTLMDGDSLSPCQYSYDYGYYGLTVPQNSLILPLPNDTNIYYIFHGALNTPSYKYTEKFYYSIVDMRLDSGLGGIVSKNNLITSDSLSGGMVCAVRHANGRDWWITAPHYGGDSVLIFLLTPIGISNIHSVYFNTFDSNSFIGQTVFSLDGSIYARNDQGTKKVLIYDFDRCNGSFNNQRTIQYGHYLYGGVAISPNSKVLYVTSIDTVFQYDLTASNLALSQQIVAVYDSFASPFGSTFFQAQLGANGKIYISCGNAESVIHVIDYPDSLGMACHVCQHCINLPAYLAWGLPNYPNFRLKQLIGSPCDTLGIGIEETPMKINARIYPNPTKSWLIFEPSISLIEPANLELYSLIGDLTFSQKLNPWQGQYLINVEGLSAGMYILRISNKRGIVFNGKFVKN